MDNLWTVPSGVDSGLLPGEMGSVSLLLLVFLSSLSHSAQSSLLPPGGSGPSEIDMPCLMLCVLGKRGADTSAIRTVSLGHQGAFLTIPSVARITACHFLIVLAPDFLVQLFAFQLSFIFLGGGGSRCLPHRIPPAS